MQDIGKHPTVKSYLGKQTQNERSIETKLEYSWLRTLCLDAGADDVGFVEIGRPEVASEKADILSYFPQTKTLIALVCKLNREPIRSIARSVANLEFHHTGDKIDETAHGIVSQLEMNGVRSINPAMGFPMEMEKFPGKIWLVSHKTVAVAAGLGKMGIHRNVIHPKFGNFILLGTILMDAEVTASDHPIEYNPCLECKLCVAACPTGAIGADGHFDFAACYTHNYREFMGGFTDWVETVTESKTAREYRSRVPDSESVSIWQSLSYGANYKAAYCMSVCPAGEDVIGPYLSDKREFLQTVVNPLQEKKETIYVIPDSDAESYVKHRFKNKRARRIGNGLRPQSIAGFLEGLSLTFQRGQSKGLAAKFHFTFTGREPMKATVEIRNQQLKVTDGHEHDCDMHLVADSETWLKFLAKDTHILWALLRRKIRIQGSLRLLRAFARCFPA